MPISSIIKWPGGKRSQAARIAALFPGDLHADAVYYEPFLGGGALLWHAAAAFNRVVCGDVYAPLIAIWRGVLDNPAEVSADYRRPRFDPVAIV